MKQINRYQNKKVLVMGLAKSGKAAANLLKDLGANVIINDKTPLEQNQDAKDMIEKGFNVITGEHPVALLGEGLDLIVKNPGIPYRHVPLLVEAQKRQIPILTEIELAYQISDAPFIGITGSNGKTTTTTLIFEMLEESGKQPLIAGNIGEVATLVAQSATSENVMVTELSSFQLMGIDTFRPKISLLLNITEAHLDYHNDLSEYQQAKLGLIKNQTRDDVCVFNADDAVIVEGIKKSEVTKIPFSLTKRVEGAYLQGEDLYFKDEFIMSSKELLLKGRHNLEDVLAAIAVVKQYGCDTEAIKVVLKRFVGVKHRLQFVSKVNGVSYYNNSKATNSIATEMALQAFEEPIILLVGGLDRGHDITGIIPYLTNVKAMICFGETRHRFATLAKEQNILFEVFETLPHVVLRAHEIAKPNDIVLLSPACASWDQYKAFEERGEHFISLVQTLND